MKRNVSLVRFKIHCNVLISGKIIKEMPGSVASGTYCISYLVSDLNPYKLMDLPFLQSVVFCLCQFLYV